MQFRCYLALALIGLAPVGATVADEAEDLLEVRNTVINLLQSLVERDILTRDEASAMVSKAQADARDQMAARRADEPTLEEGDVRVTYIPEVVRDDISAQVSEAVRETVIADVKADARAEGWGVPAALPNWIESIRLYGDTRVR
ncbi:MAG: putative porin, partial [Pseudomonadota bacterium]